MATNPVERKSLPKKGKQLYSVHIIMKLPPPYDMFVHSGVDKIQVKKGMLEVREKKYIYRYDGRDIKEIRVKKLRGKGFID